MKNRAKIFLIMLLAFPYQAGATADHYAPRAPSSPEFQRMKALAGRWQGTSVSGEKTEEAAVEYQVTSGGSAVVEKLFSGMPHEMISVYHDQSGKLVMTHYCMLGNQPRFQLRSSDAGHLKLELAKKSGINAKKETHMHSLEISFADPDHITQKWTLFEKGKPKDSTVITLSRVG